MSAMKNLYTALQIVVEETPNPTLESVRKALEASEYAHLSPNINDDMLQLLIDETRIMMQALNDVEQDLTVQDINTLVDEYQEEMQDQ